MREFIRAILSRFIGVTTDQLPRTAVVLLVGLVLLVTPSIASAQTQTQTQTQTIVVGSKRFTESCVLAEIAKRVLTDAGFQVDLRQQVGSTTIVWEALSEGQITVYPEYTGTISEEILKQPGLDRGAMEKELAKQGIGISPDLGFNDAYGVVMRRETAQKLGITKISDLRSHPDLTAGITPEFLKRKDGWGPLSAKYGIALKDPPRSIDHALGYAALYAGQIDIKDCYTTDAEIKKFDLVVLQDDLHVLPLYKAVFLYRLSMPAGAVKAIDSLAGKIKESKMIDMNAIAGKDGAYAKAASTFFAVPGNSGSTVIDESLVTQTLRLTKEHLEMVGASLLLAIVVGIPLGIAASRPGFLSSSIIGTAGVIQTIPSLALLTLLVPIPFFGLTEKTAIAALFLYSLLPIIRNTAVGISTIPPSLKESAEALGLEPWARLRKVYLPIALPTILAGVKTSAVINVGTATLAALLGAGGLGQPIFEGVSLNNNTIILQGAIPAAVLALLVQGVFEVVDRLVVPRGLRANS